MSQQSQEMSSQQLLDEIGKENGFYTDRKQSSHQIGSSPTINNHFSTRSTFYTSRQNSLPQTSQQQFRSTQNQNFVKSASQKNLLKQKNQKQTLEDKIKQQELLYIKQLKEKKEQKRVKINGETFQQHILRYQPNREISKKKKQDIITEHLLSHQKEIKSNKDKKDAIEQKKSQQINFIQQYSTRSPTISPVMSPLLKKIKAVNAFRSTNNNSLLKSSNEISLLSYGKYQQQSQQQLNEQQKSKVIINEEPQILNQNINNKNNNNVNNKNLRKTSVADNQHGVHIPQLQLNLKRAVQTALSSQRDKSNTNKERKINEKPIKKDNQYISLDQLEKREQDAEINKESLQSLQFSENQEDLDLDDQLLIMVKLMDAKAQLQGALEHYNETKAHEVVFQMIKYSIELDLLDLYLESLNLLGEVITMFGDFKTSLKIFEMLRVLCDLVQNHQCKILVLQSIANICKRLHLYEQSISFLKRCLEYAWYLEEKDLEIQIYEDISICLVMMGDFKNAEFLHSRSMQGIHEDKNSISVKVARKKLDQYIKEIKSRSNGVDILIMSKSFQGPYKFVKMEENEQHENYVTNKCMIQNRLKLQFQDVQKEEIHDELQQVTLILSHLDFLEEIPLPRQSYQQQKAIKQLDNIAKNQNAKKNMLSRSAEFAITVHLHKFKKQIPKTKLESRATTFRLEEKDKKRPMEEIIKKRIELERQEEIKKQVTGISSYERTIMKKYKVNNKIHKTHLTVNRLLDNYQYSVSVLLSKNQIYFDKMLHKYFKSKQDYIQQQISDQQNQINKNQSEHKEQ